MKLAFIKILIDVTKNNLLKEKAIKEVEALEEMFNSPLLICDHFNKCAERDMCRRARPSLHHTEYKCPFQWEARLVEVRIEESIQSSIPCELHYQKGDPMNHKFKELTWVESTKAGIKSIIASSPVAQYTIVVHKDSVSCRYWINDWDEDFIKTENSIEVAKKNSEEHYQKTMNEKLETIKSYII